MIVILTFLIFQSEEDLDFKGGPPGGDSYGGPPGGGSYGGGGGGGGIGFENFGNPGGNPIDTLPNIPAMAGGNPGMAYPPPVSTMMIIIIIIIMSI